MCFSEVMNVIVGLYVTIKILWSSVSLACFESLTCISNMFYGQFNQVLGHDMVPWTFFLLSYDLVNRLIWSSSCFIYPHKYLLASHAFIILLEYWPVVHLFHCYAICRS